MGINPGLLMALSALDNVDTKSYDNVNTNFQKLAEKLSQDPNFGSWTWSVDGSDDARQRAEQATWASYLDKIQPLYNQQTDDLQARLVNQGLTPGSEAYQRAMSDLQDRQNSASNQAAYAATLNGQNAFTQSLNDSINAANFGNNAQLGNQDRIWNLLSNSMSSYDKEMQKANLLSEYYNQKANAPKKAGASGALSGAASGAAAGSAFGPWGALAGAAIGGFTGYNQKG
jgi:hypothetical protein